MDTNEPTLSTGAAEIAGVGVIATPPRRDVIGVPPRHSKTMAMAAMLAAVGAPEMGAAPAARRLGSPYLDLATKHGTAAALKAEAPQAPLLDNEHRIAQRAARKVRMARRRRRGF